MKTNPEWLEITVKMKILSQQLSIMQCSKCHIYGGHIDLSFNPQQDKNLIYYLILMTAYNLVCV